MRLFITLFICSYLQSTSDEYFKKPINFDADIIINNQENLISKGKILFRDGSFTVSYTHLRAHETEA